MQAVVSNGLTWVAGDEGSGKTTLLRLLAGQHAPTSGALEGFLAGAALGSPAWLAQVFWQDPRSNAHDATVVNDYLAAQQLRWPHWRADLFAELVGELDLSEHLHKRFNMLSAGTRRKIWLVTAFASGAALTLLDEPFAALDKASQRGLHDLLQDTIGHPTRAWVVADYEVPKGLRPDQLIALPN